LKRVRTGGGWHAVRYAWKTARRAGLVRFVRAMRSRNACKTCALGMGGQRGAMVDESGRFPEVCKKSMQAMAADLQDGIAPAFFARYGLDELGQLTPRELEHLGRLVNPLYAGPEDTHYRVISWDDALARCVDRLRGTAADKHFFYASGRSSNEAAFLLQLFARLYGINHVNNCSYYCHQASGVGLGSTLGTGTATIQLEDLAKCDTVFLIGGNPASNHPRLMRQLVNVRRRGGHVVVVNPQRETGLVNFSVPSDLRSLLFGSPVASQYVQPHIGGDIALLTGIAKWLDAHGAVDRAFVSRHTEGWEEYRRLLQETTWDVIVERSGVPSSEIEAAASTYAQAKNAVFAWTMGITHHTHGVDNVRTIVNLALMRGMVGRPAAGLLPIRGHSNVQGVGSVGVTPALKKAVFERLESHLGVNLPTSRGFDTLECMRAAEAGELTGAWCLGGNLFGANPDTTWAKRAMNRLESIVYFSTTLNTGHIHGRGKETIILPMRARDEESQPTTQESMFNYVRLSDGVSGDRIESLKARHEGPRSEVETIARIARGVLGDDGVVDWASLETHRNIRQMIGRIVPGFERIAKIDDTKREFQIGGRTFHEPKFATPSGKARFFAPAIPTPIGTAHELRLMTIRSEGQFNTVVYEEEDVYRHQDRRDVILINEADIHRRKLYVDQPVTVRSVAGEMKDVLVRPFDIRAGNAAMYYPEANVLVPTDVDPESKTPAFKAVAVTLVQQPVVLARGVGTP